MRRILRGHHPPGEQVVAGEVARRHPDTELDLQGQVLDDNVIGQSYAKKVLSIAVHNQYKRLIAQRLLCEMVHNQKQTGSKEVGASTLLIAFIGRPDVGLIPCGSTQKERPPASPQAAQV